MGGPGGVPNGGAGGQAGHDPVKLSRSRNNLGIV